jgi:hypothetical protein
VNKTKDDAVEKAAVAVDSTKQEASAVCYKLYKYLTDLLKYLI